MILNSINPYVKILRAHAGPSTLRSFNSSSRRLARTHGNLSHYDVLSLSKNSTKQQIKARFYELSKQYHPDAKGGDTLKFHEINDAYAILGDDSKRRQYDLSIIPASQSRSSQTYGTHSHGTSGHSSFSPRDPYLHRAAQGPHRAWNSANAQMNAKSGNNPKTENYTPFGRKTPPNFQYSYEYNFNYNPNARTSKTRRKDGIRNEEEEGNEHNNSSAGGGGIWKFVVTVGLIFTVISLGGGLTANSQDVVDWKLPQERLEEQDES
ncbi:uncharacterized protein I206_100981 [Kwoniella pini CBS 10737]|uniref:J domain-containing protein n=1 Tax=Kwoniella pini CBS 10737 TaxID=1296096 RepID=A0A1B9IC82_9TREE|nr:uncharacterized protein I206_00345 [Kwoniella pini CBS 10737]OCF53044.1 hypothetical protein I206_00345 [Kwoniella pini CBS 10737]